MSDLVELYDILSQISKDMYEEFPELQQLIEKVEERIEEEGEDCGYVPEGFYGIDEF